MQKQFECALCTTQYDYIPPNGCDCTEEKTTLINNPDYDHEKHSGSGAKKTGTGCMLIFALITVSSVGLAFLLF